MQFVQVHGVTVPLCEVVRVRRRGGVIVQWCDIYIGRKQTQGGWNITQDSPWANPFTIKEYGSPETACLMYYQWIKQQPIFANIESLRGTRIGCWCNLDPRPLYDILTTPRCHGEVIMRLLYEQLFTSKVPGVPGAPPSDHREIRM